MSRIVDIHGNEADTEVPDNLKEAQVNEYMTETIQLATQIKDLVSQEMTEKQLTFLQALGALSMFHSKLTASLLEAEHKAILAYEGQEDTPAE